MTGGIQFPKDCIRSSWIQT